MQTIYLIGSRGVVSLLLQRALAKIDIKVFVIATDDFLSQLSHTVAIQQAVRINPQHTLVVICAQNFLSETIVDELPIEARVLDISPTFRQDPQWTYGLQELKPQCVHKDDHRVANPGCFATSAILLLDPLLYDGISLACEDFYMDGVGGYSTGGSKMMDTAIAGQLATECAYSLSYPHPHVEEIRHHCRITGDVIFTPKIANFYSGIRMQTYIPSCTRDEVLNAYTTYYDGTPIIVDKSTPSKIRGDAWAGVSGACIWVYQQGSGCLVVCAMDNLKKGAVDTAMDNIKLMLDL